MGKVVPRVRAVLSRCAKNWHELRREDRAIISFMNWMGIFLLCVVVSVVVRHFGLTINIAMTTGDIAKYLGGLMGASFIFALWQGAFVYPLDLYGTQRDAKKRRAEHEPYESS